MSSRKSKLFVLASAATVAASIAASGHAATRTWQNPGGGGDWNTAANWSGSLVPGIGDLAQIGGIGTTNTNPDLNGGTFSLDGLILIPRTSGFSGSSFTITSTGAGTLNVGSAGIVVRNGALATIGSTVTLNLTSSQNWGGGNDAPNIGNGLTVNGLIAGAAKITLTDANSDNTGVFTFANGGNTFGGGFQIDKRTAALAASSVVASGSLASGPLGLGTVTLNGGTLRSDGGTARTLHNNVAVTNSIVTLGNTSGAGTLTFSDAGLTTPSTFALARSGNAAVSTLRLGANLNLDQAISETGGIGQSVHFALASGSSTVTVNRTKTSAGNILGGGVNLVLANGAANAGNLVLINGSATATGSNRFSSGSLVSDGAALIATDATNYASVRGLASVYNNGRVSFATDQTQATVASLFSSDSQLRLGLGSAALSPTVTQNYNQSAMGNGRAGLVSASTGTVTYTGTLTPGSDATYRVGGGAGTLSLTASNTLTGNNDLIVEGGGTLSIGNAQDYAGTTTVNSALTLQGPTASINGSSGIAVNNATLTFDNTGGNSNSVNRFNDSATITLNRGTLSTINNGTGSPTAITETFAGLTLAGGLNTVSMSNAPGTGTKTIQFGTLTRQNNAVALFRGDSFGPNAGSLATRNVVRITGTTPTLIGGGGAEGTTNVSILPWARGGSSGTSSGSTFATVDSATGLVRLLNTTTEFAQANASTTINTAIAANTDRNVRANIASGSATLLTGPATVNSLLIDNTGATATGTYGLGGQTLTVDSGAVAFIFAANQDVNFNNGTLAFGAREAVITTSGNARFFSLGTNVTGSGGATFIANNGNMISLAGISGSGLTGTVTVSGVGVDQDQRFGAAANPVVHAGGSITYFASNYSTTRNFTLLGGVGSNTFDFQTQSSAQNYIMAGVIDGAGTLRRVQSIGGGGSVATNLTLSNANTYTGGTIIEGSTLTAANNSALGTGTVTLVNANNASSSLTFTSAAPAIGGLRGTDGTVTINPTVSAATLTIGSNNDSTVFNGVITQASGKTGSLTKVGTGTLVLGGNNAYTGSTRVQGGRLFVAGTIANNASSSVLLSAPGTSFTSTTPEIVRAIPTSGVYAGIGASSIDSSILSFSAAADLLAGSAGSGGRAVSMSYRLRNGPESSLLASDVVRITGMNAVGATVDPDGRVESDLFVLSMNYDEATALSLAGTLDETAAASDGAIALGYLNPGSGSWVNAVSGNFGGTATFAGIASAPVTASLGNLGTWGIEPSSNTVWAVLNHNSQFSVVVTPIPEPTTLAAFGGIALLALRRRRAGC